MPQLEVNGTRLHYQTMGNGEVVVMLHGLLVGNLATWYFGPASELAIKNQVLLYDLRGHGMSEQTSGGYRLQDMVEDLEALVEAKNFKSLSLVGHSYGALVALHFALRNPERVKKLVLVEAPLPPSRVTQMESFFKKNPEEILASLPDPIRKSMSLQGRQSKKFLGRMNFLLFETSILADLKAEKDIDDEVLKTLLVPTLLLYGKAGQLAEVAARLNRCLLNSRVEWLEGGHYLPGEMPTELSAKVGEFFA